MSGNLSRRWLKDLLIGAVLLAGGGSLVIWPQLSAGAVKDGLLLCFDVIIPALFPFFVLSALVVDLGLAGYIGRGLEKIMRPLFNVPGTCAAALTLGLIGGYPVGAQTAIDLYRKGLCGKGETERLLAFCNNCGPAFILGVVGTGIFANRNVGLLLYLTHVAASLCVGIIFRFYKHGENTGRDDAVTVSVHAKRISEAFTGAVKNSFGSILNLCAFVVFFTVLIRMLTVTGIVEVLSEGLVRIFHPFGMTDRWGERLLIGIMEISSGVCTLSEGTQLAGRVPMAAFMLGWAGISVHCQVLSFMGGSGLSVRPYLMGKLLQGVISALLAGILLRVFPFEVPALNHPVGEITQGLLPNMCSVLTVSVAAWAALWTAFFVVGARMVRKNSGKGRTNVV